METINLSYSTTSNKAIAIELDELLLKNILNLSEILSYINKVTKTYAFTLSNNYYLTLYPLEYNQMLEIIDMIVIDKKVKIILNNQD